jgi:ribosomal protein S2
VFASLLQNGHIYVLGGNPTLRPILDAAARSCINSKVWFMRDRWRPGTLTNYASHQRLFKEDHQPNRA